MADGLAGPTLCAHWTAAAADLSALSSVMWVMCQTTPMALVTSDTPRSRICPTPTPEDSLGIICAVSLSLLPTFQHSLIDTQCARFSARIGRVQHQTRKDLGVRELTLCRRDTEEGTGFPQDILGAGL